MVRSSNDAADLAAAARGDGRAIGRLYDANVGPLYAFVFHRVGGDATLAEDVVQETFTQAIGRGADYAPDRGMVGAWLASLSRNVIRDHLREHRRGTELAAAWERIDRDLAAVFASLDVQPLPREVIERDETRQLVQMTCSNLPESYRRALISKYVDGDSLETIARQLGLSVEGAKSHLARARRAFRDAIVAISASMSEVTP